VQKYRSIMAQMPFGWAGMMPSSLPRVLAMCAAVAVLASGCSPEVAFPGIHDMPPPPATTATAPVVGAKKKKKAKAPAKPPAKATAQAAAAVGPATADGSKP
jgi:hypothetical protein